MSSRAEVIVTDPAELDSTTSPEHPESHRRDTLIAAAIGLLGFASLWAFSRLGWFMQDEGVLYYHYHRVYQGQVPYRDFFTGYPPMMYYLHAALFWMFGVSIPAVRLVMAALHSATAVMLYLTTRRFAPPTLAVIPAVLFLTLQPGDIAVMVFHNSPYPSWYAVFFSVFGFWTVLRWVESQRTGSRNLWLLATGALGGLTLLSKQNAGIFFLWGISGFLCSHPEPPLRHREAEPLLPRMLRSAYLLLIPLATLLLVKNFLGPVPVLLFVLPVFVLAASGMVSRFSARATVILLIRLAWVAAGTAVVTLPWLVYGSMQMGLAAFLRGMFMVGADVDRTLYVPLPQPEAASIALMALLAFWWVSPASRRRWIALAMLGVIAALAIRLDRAVVQLARFEYDLWQVYSAVSTNIDNAILYLCILAIGVALSRSLLRFHERETASRSGLPQLRSSALLWLAVCLFAQYYPRMDYAHLFSAAPLVYVLAVALVPPAPKRMAAGARIWKSRTALGFCLALAMVVAGVKSIPKLYSRVTLTRTENGIRLAPASREWLQLEGAELYFPIYLERQRLYLREFERLIGHIRATTSPDEPIFAFPALPMIYLLAGRPNPARHDYFLGNNVNYAEQLEIIRTLEDRQVGTVILASDPRYDYFVEKGWDFTRLIRAYLQERYYLEQRFGPYDLLRRYGSQPGRDSLR